MTAFIVVPKTHQGGRSTLWEIIDTDGSKHRQRLGFIEDENQARALAQVLNGADSVYRAELKKHDNAEPF